MAVRQIISSVITAGGNTIYTHVKDYLGNVLEKMHGIGLYDSRTRWYNLKSSK